MQVSTFDFFRVTRLGLFLELSEVLKSSRELSHGLDLCQSDVANEFSLYSNCIKISRKTVQMESLVETNFMKCI